MSYTSKRASLVQEVIHRMMNISTDNEQSVRDSVLDEFDECMKMSGYYRDDLMHIIEAGVTGYERKK